MNVTEATATRDLKTLWRLERRMRRAEAATRRQIHLSTRIGSGPVLVRTSAGTIEIDTTGQIRRQP